MDILSIAAFGIACYLAGLVTGGVVLPRVVDAWEALLIRLTRWAHHHGRTQHSRGR